MKIGVVDNGATKSEWVVWDKATGAPKCFFFSGIQPRNMNEKQLFNHFEPIAREISYACDTLYYFSTGLFAEEVRTKVANVLGHFFEHVQTGTDLEGTGRAILGGENGAVAILGTGSNVGTYVNHQIIDQPLSLGYLLGDEGSGADLGKRFLKHYLESGFEKPVDYAINDLFQGTKTDLINHLNQNADSKWLASFVPVLSQYRGVPAISNIIKESFQGFYEHLVSRLKVPHNQLAFSGSVAALFRNELTEVTREYGYCVYKVVQHPAMLLFDYYLKASEN